MIKFLRRAILVVAACFAMAAQAQQMPAIPVDKDVRIGQLPNGLTYYIRHNETPKGQADFYIAQKVGSILEDDSQRGLAHFLEHMCFNGTKNFPGNGIVDWCESVGIKFGRNLNAYTSIDQTVYNISNVPVARTGVQDSVLLILHDWANDLTLDPEEIEKERGVIHQEWRRSMVGQMRILEKLLPTMYPNSKYGYRLPIGTMEVVDNFKPQVLRDYYETWYRPDQQGIIVVGDIDVDYIEGKIKELFSPIEMPTNAQAREYFPVEDTPGTIYAIGSDKEQTIGIVELMFKSDATPLEAKTTIDYMLMQYVMDMIQTMFDQRLTDISNTPDAPFAQAGADFGNFFLAKTKDAFNVSVVAKGNDILPGFECAYRELLRAARGGFTIGEYERARAEYISRLEKEYNGRDKRENGTYVQEYVNNFLDNEPMPSVEDGFQIYSQISQMVSVDAINMLFKQVITPDNRVLLSLNPDNGAFKIPTEAEFKAIVEKVDAEDIEPYKDTMKEEPLIPVLPTPGKVVSVADDAQWGAKVITLSNGVKVWVKTTDFKKDEILFGASAIGGSSVIPDNVANSLIFLPVAISNYGLGDYNNTDLTKYLQGKQANISFQASNYNRELDGSTTVKDLPTLMELIYMYFTNFTITEDDYSTAANMYSSILANQEANPQYVFQKNLTKALYESAASQSLTPEAIAGANRQEILDIMHRALSNAAEYTFYFVGDITVEQITPLLEQYIATLPASSNVAENYVINTAREAKAGKGIDNFTTKMETPQTWCLIMLEGEMPYTAKNREIASMVGQILSNRLLKKIREEMGAVYSISAMSNMRRVGKYNTFIQIPFPMKPELKNDVLKEIDKMVKGLAKNVTEDELNPIKEYMAKSAVEDKEKNSSWRDTMQATALNGVDVFNGNVENINSVTVKDVKNFMKAFLKQGNYRTVILDPEE